MPSTPSATARMEMTSRVRNDIVLRTCLLRVEAVTDTAHGVDLHGVIDLLAHLCDVHVDGAHIAVPVVTPDAVEDLLAAHGEARPLGEEAEQVELFGGERDCFVVDPHLAAADVDRDAADLDDLGGSRAAFGAPPDRLPRPH